MVNNDTKGKYDDLIYQSLQNAPMSSLGGGEFKICGFKQCGTLNSVLGMRICCLLFELFTESCNAFSIFYNLLFCIIYWSYQEGSDNTSKDELRT